MSFDSFFSSQVSIFSQKFILLGRVVVQKQEVASLHNHGLNIGAEFL